MTEDIKIYKTQQIQSLSPEIISSLVLNGDLSKLNPTQKVQYYNSMCERIGFDPATQPFKLLNLKGKEVLYADKSAAQQLNRMYKISHEVKNKERIDDVYCVTVRASNVDGFQDEDGAVAIKGLTGEALANALMKAITKAKRRATLALCGLSMMDESELDTVRDAVTVPIDHEEPKATLHTKPEVKKIPNPEEQVKAYISEIDTAVSISHIKDIYKDAMNYFRNDKDIIATLKGHCNKRKEEIEGGVK